MFNSCVQLRAGKRTAPYVELYVNRFAGVTIFILTGISVTTITCELCPSKTQSTLRRLKAFSSRGVKGEGLQPPSWRLYEDYKIQISVLILLFIIQFFNVESLSNAECCFEVSFPGLISSHSFLRFSSIPKYFSSSPPVKIHNLVAIVKQTPRSFAAYVLQQIVHLEDKLQLFIAINTRCHESNIFRNLFQSANNTSTTVAVFETLIRTLA